VNACAVAPDKVHALVVMALQVPVVVVMVVVVVIVVDGILVLEFIQKVGMVMVMEIAKEKMETTMETPFQMHHIDLDISPHYHVHHHHYPTPPPPPPPPLPFLSSKQFHYSAALRTQQPMLQPCLYPSEFVLPVQLLEHDIDQSDYWIYYSPVVPTKSFFVAECDLE
jgi:hypothetical protein